MFAMGRTIRRPWWKVRRGRIVGSGAAENEDLLRRVLASSKASKARIGWFTVGLNPAAEPVMLDNSIVKDDVGIGLGPHPQLERKATDPSVSFYATLGPATLEIGR
jgi:hypothetical protein